MQLKTYFTKFLKNSLMKC